MNYLSHLFLSPEEPLVIQGNFIGDIIRRREEILLHEGHKTGVALHRFIDHQTDHHPIVVKHRGALYTHFRKYAGVILDIYYDHLLFLNWADLANEPFLDFEQRMYGHLTFELESLPERIQIIINGMTSSRWLRTYTSEEGMRRVIERTKMKMSRPEYVGDVMSILSDNQEEWREHHRELIIDLQKSIRSRF
jgi:acyl carrier protein phosphodiesterase